MPTRRSRAVVTGGAGFLGSHLCERLLTDGREVIRLDNFVTGTPATVAHLAETGGPRGGYDEAREQLGWERRVPLDEGLKTTISWIRDAKGGGQDGRPGEG